MSKDWYQDIVKFQKEVMCNDFLTIPHVPDARQQALQVELIKEETKELLEAIETSHLEQIADGGADVIVVVLGAMVAHGIDLRPIWDLVHESNMAKKGGPMRSDGKRLKPPGWRPPNIAYEIRRQQEL